MAMILKAAMDNDLCREVLGTRTYTTSKVQTTSGWDYNIQLVFAEN